MENCTILTNWEIVHTRLLVETVRSQVCMPLRGDVLLVKIKVKTLLLRILVCTDFYQVKILCHLAGKDNLSQHHVWILVHCCTLCVQRY